MHSADSAMQAVAHCCSVPSGYIDITREELSGVSDRLDGDLSLSPGKVVVERPTWRAGLREYLGDARPVISAALQKVGCSPYHEGSGPPRGAISSAFASTIART